MDRVFAKQQSLSPGNLEDILASLAGVAVVGFDSKGSICFFDRQAEAMFGLSSDDAINAKGLRLFEDESAFSGLMKEVEESGGSAEADLVGLNKSRNSYGMALHVTLMHVKQTITEDVRCLGLLRDDSVRREAERAARDFQDHGRRQMRQSEKEAEFLRELLRHTNETIQIGLAVQDLPSGMIAYMNEAFEDTTGLDRKAVLGMTFEQAFAEFPQTRDLFCGYIKRIRDSVNLKSGPPPAVHWNVRLKTGEKRIEVYGRPIVVEGHENQYLLLIVEDHTVRERLQTQLVQSEKLAAVGQLAAGIAHEIRNPLNTIYNALYDLKELIENPCDDVEEDIAISMDEIKRVQDIINNLLDFARDSGRISGQANLNDIIGQTIRLVDHDLIKKNISVNCELGTIPDVTMNSNALKQILINLITNAGQAMEESGGGELGVRTYCPQDDAGIARQAKGGTYSSHVRLTPPGVKEGSPLSDRHGQGNTVVLEITDTGPGIPEETISDIFNPFYTTKPPGQGTGLGLSVVHSLITEAGGAISASSQMGVGTCFSIELPIVPDSDLEYV